MAQILFGEWLTAQNQFPVPILFITSPLQNKILSQQQQWQEKIIIFGGVRQKNSQRKLPSVKSPGLNFFM